MARGPSRPAFHWLSAQVSPVMARGPSGPAYHCLLRNLPRLWRTARPRSERSVGGQLSFAFCFIYPPLWRAARAGQPFIAFLPNLPPLWCAAEAGLFIIALLCNLPPLWRGLSSERALRRRPVIICLLFHLPTFMAHGLSGPAFHCLSAQFSLVMARGPSGPAYHCLSAQFAPVMARGPSSERAFRRRPSYHLPFVSFAHLYGVRPERASF